MVVAAGPHRGVGFKSATWGLGLQAVVALRGSGLGPALCWREEELRIHAAGATPCFHKWFMHAQLVTSCADIQLGPTLERSHRLGKASKTSYSGDITSFLGAQAGRGSENLEMRC